MSFNQSISAERIRQENEVTAGFFQVLQKRVDQIANGQGASKFELDEPERQVLLRINNSGLLKGAAAGILSLVFLRRVRSGLLNRVMLKVQQQKQQQAGRGPTHVGNSPFQPPVQPIPPLSTNTPLENVLRRRQNPWSLPNVLGWFLDISVSFFVAATSSVVFTDRKMVLESVSNLPLIEGKSRIAVELCPSMVEHYRKLLKEHSQVSEILEHPQTDYLKAIRAFCVNCQRRKRQEDMLRLTMGLDATSDVSIPSPGVTVMEDDVDLWRDQGDDGSQNQDDGSFYDVSQENDSTQWADDFVLDQGEDDNDQR
ncbi:hypothetical protein MPSEU_000684000 [Mayamaea pseudoterrestris]|nr:hypothetical protein MPSEU_000684000 [Mayamaea pseudoterrestris]